jgi:hypothetical protein
VCGQSSQPNQSGGDRNKGLESDVEFVVARRDAAKLFETSKEPFNEISTFVDMFVITPEFDSIGFWRNNGHGLHCLDNRQKAVGVKGLVGYHRTHVLHAFNEIRSFGDVVSFATGQTKPGQIAQAINGCMNLGAQAPTRAAKTLLPVFLGAPAACWCARTIVLSRKTSSKSASSQSLAKRICQTPLSAQREKRLNTVFHGPNQDGDRARVTLFSPSTVQPQRIGDCPHLFGRDLPPCHGASALFATTGRHATTISASRLQPKRQDVNTIIHL